ncbi:MAG TPA: type II secretion system protein [bacterium]|nr:type II secretion system protein [bacterium]
MKNCPENKKGFTLVELMVSLSIIIVLISLAVINYNIGFSENNLTNAQSISYQNIRLAQSYALSFKSYDDTLPGYWGVYFEKGTSTIILFADLNSNYSYDEGEADILLGGKTISLPKDILIDYISWNSLDLNVLFEVGSGRMLTYSSDIGSPDLNYWQIELKDEHYDIGKIISLSSLGKLDVYDCSCDNIEKYCCDFCVSKDNCIDIESP